MDDAGYRTMKEKIVQKQIPNMIRLWFILGYKVEVKEGQEAEFEEMMLGDNAAVHMLRAILNYFRNVERINFICSEKEPFDLNCVDVVYDPHMEKFDDSNYVFLFIREGKGSMNVYYWKKNNQ